MNKFSIFLLSLTLTTLTVSCKKEANLVDPVTPGGSGAMAQRGIVSGRALDGAGKPLPNASIVVNNSQFYNQNIRGKPTLTGATAFR